MLATSARSGRQRPSSATAPTCSCGLTPTRSRTPFARSPTRSANEPVDRLASLILGGEMSDQATNRYGRLADEELVRAHAHRLKALAATLGVTQVRYAGPGRLVGHVAEDRDFFDVADFQTAASEELQAEVELFSDAVLEKPHSSPDLHTAKPL